MHVSRCKIAPTYANAKGGEMLKFVRKGERLRGVEYKSSNIIIQKLHEGTGRDRCFFIGSGYTLNVDDEDRVTWHDPFMIKQEYGLAEDITVYTFYYTYECEGLGPAANEIAAFVNTIFEKYERIFLVGHSKCGLCLCSTTEYLNDLVTLATISTPFDGTIVADGEAVARKVKSKVFLKLYNMIFSNHEVDKDIIPGSEFIKNLKDPVCKEHLNFKTRLDRNGFQKSPLDYLLLIVDKTLELYGDGVVPYSSQSFDADKETTMICSHANSLVMGVKMLEKYSQLMN